MEALTPSLLPPPPSATLTERLRRGLHALGSAAERLCANIAASDQDPTAAHTWARALHDMDAALAHEHARVCRVAPLRDAAGAAAAASLWDVRDELWRLSMQYRCELTRRYPLAALDHAQFSLRDGIALVALRCALLAHALAPVIASDADWAAWPTQWLGARPASLDGLPARQFMHAQELFRGALSVAPFSPELIWCAQILEVRAAVLALETHPAFVLNVGALRFATGASDADGMRFHANWPFVQSMGAVCSEIHRKFAERAIVAHVVDAPQLRAPLDYNGLAYAGAVRPDARAACLRWFVDRAREFTVNETGVAVRRYLKRTSLRPGDRACYELRKPGELQTDHDVLIDARGEPRAQALDRACSQSTRDAVITEGAQHLAALERADARGDARPPEPLVLQLALIDATSLLLRGLGTPLEWLAVVFFAPDYSEGKDDDSRDADDVYDGMLRRARVAPLLVQAFNHMQLLYRDTMYWYNSYVEALVAWTLLVDALLCTSQDADREAFAQRPDALEADVLTLHNAALFRALRECVLAPVPAPQRQLHASSEMLASDLVSFHPCS